MDAEFAKMLKQLIVTTNVRNDPAALKMAQDLHAWLDDLISGKTAVFNCSPPQPTDGVRCAE